MAAPRKPKPDKKPPTGKVKPRDPASTKRKIGERVETMKKKLSPMEVDDVNRAVVDLLAQVEKLEEEKKTSTGGLANKIKELKSRIRIETTVAQRAAREVEVTVEEWLDSRTNEVTRIRTDTGEQVGARNARPGELQETLFDDDDDEPDAKAAPPPPAGEPEDDVDDAAVAGDFGGVQ